MTTRAGIALLGWLWISMAAYGQVPTVRPEVRPAAEIEVEILVVQNKTSTTISTDKATLPVGRKGGVTQLVELKDPKTGATIQVDVAVITRALAATTLAAEVEVETMGRVRDDARPPSEGVVRSRRLLTFEPGVTKLVNVFEYEPLEARIMAVVRAQRTEPQVSITKLVGEETGASVPDLRSVQFTLDIKRYEFGEEVYSESLTLNTWLGRSVSYEMGHEIPTEIIPGEGGQGEVRYSSERAELVLTPAKLEGAELEVTVEMRGSIYRGSDLVNAYGFDASERYRVSRGKPFDVYAMYGEPSIKHLSPETLTRGSGYHFVVRASF